MTQLARQARAASRELARLTTAEKNECLRAMADALEKDGSDIKTANARDMETAAQRGLSEARPDRAAPDDTGSAGGGTGGRGGAGSPGRDGGRPGRAARGRERDDQRREVGDEGREGGRRQAMIARDA